MNEYSKNKIEELKAVPLRESKEWGWVNFTKKFEGRKVYWTWTQEIHVIKYICPMTNRIWFTETFNGWARDTNALSEMYLIPETNDNFKVRDFVFPNIIYNTLLKKDKYEVRSIYNNKIEILSDYHGLKWYLTKNFKK